MHLRAALLCLVGPRLPLIFLFRPKNGGKEILKEPLKGLHPVLKGPIRALPIGLPLPTVPEKERVRGKVLKRVSITLTTCLVLLLLLSRTVTLLLIVWTESPLGGIPMWTSALQKGKCAKIQFPCDVTHLGYPHTTRNIVNGWMELGLVIILILRRNTVIERKMMELGKIGALVRICAVAAELGTFPPPVELTAQAEVQNSKV